MVYAPTKTTEVSLFPFLSVLCAMIGVMMLLLVGVLGSRVLEAEAAREFSDDGAWPAEGAPPTPQPIRLIPDPEVQVALLPRLVEVASGKLIAQPEGREYSLAELAADPPALKEFFDKLQAARQEEYLLLLVHPSGVAEYDAVRAYLREKRYNFRIGVEPFAENWQLSPPDSDSGQEAAGTTSESQP